MKKSICFVIPTIRYGGTELFLLRLSDLISRNYYVSIVVIGKREGLYSRFEACDLKIFYIGVERKILFFKAVLSLRRFLKNENPDILYSFLYMADILVVFSTVFLKIEKIIWSLRGTNLAHGTSLHKLIIQRISIRFSRFVPDLIVACSDQAREFHIKLGSPAKKIIVIYNFLPKWINETVSKSVLATNQYPKSFVIGMAARFEKGKGHILLAESIVAFLDINPEIKVKLNYAGKNCGPNQELSKLLMRNNLIVQKLTENRLELIFTGLLEQDDLQLWFRDIDLYIMASTSLEAFPNSLAEAIAIGIPAVANSIGAASEFLPKSRINFDLSIEGMVSTLMGIYHEDLATRNINTNLAKAKIKGISDTNNIIQQFESAFRLNP
jgi:glycosyltransferase involved in cell wall biosynthesis